LSIFKFLCNRWNTLINIYFLTRVVTVSCKLHKQLLASRTSCLSFPNCVYGPLCPASLIVAFRRQNEIISLWKRSIILFNIALVCLLHTASRSQ
jgi:hypothetical protein